MNRMKIVILISLFFAAAYSKVPLRDICGAVNFLWPKVLGSVYSGNDDATFMFRVEILNTTGVERICVANLITDQFLMSTASCFKGYERQTNRMFLFADTETDVSPTQLQIRMVIPHPDFNKTGYMDHDFALVQLREPLDLVNSPHKPICLINSCDDENDRHLKIAFVYGWGSNRLGNVDYITPGRSDPMSKDKMKNQGLLPNNTECTESWQAAPGYNPNVNQLSETQGCYGIKRTPTRGNNLACKLPVFSLYFTKK